MSCDETLFCVKVSLLPLLRYTFFHLSPELNPPEKVFDFHEIATGVSSSVVNSFFRVFHFLFDRQIPHRALGRSFRGDRCETDNLKQLTCLLARCPNDSPQPRPINLSQVPTINNNLDNLDFQFTAINQFRANRHQQETNCSRRIKRRFEVGVERQILQVNIIILHFFSPRFSFSI